MTKKALTVEKGVPIPPVLVKQGANIALLTGMEVGDSVWWDLAEAKRAMRFYRVAKKLGLKILIRKVDENDPQGPGVRMWRMAEEAVSDDAFTL